MLFDIHSHILPCIDDGAQSIEESLDLLEMLKSQGVDYVLATPHFYPLDDDFQDFAKSTALAFKNLETKLDEKNLPKVFLGCEMLYFDGLGESESLHNFCLNNSNFLLLELTDACIDETLFENIRKMRTNSNITPIIAHIERYFKAKNFKKLIKFIAEEKIPVQINAASVLIPFFRRTIKKLIRSDIVCILGSDAHSVDMRPPLLCPALDFIKEKYGDEVYNKFIETSNDFYKKIILCDGGADEK